MMVSPESIKDAENSVSDTTGIRSGKGKRYPCTCPFCKDGVKLFVDGKRKHLCHYPECGRVFVKKNHLTSHLRSHSGEKPYICNFKSCGKSFKRSDELARHNRIHSGEKIHKCSQCSKSFSRSDHLTKHSRIHAQKNVKTKFKLPEVVYIKSELESDTSEENDTLTIKEEYLD